MIAHSWLAFSDTPHQFTAFLKASFSNANRVGLSESTYQNRAIFGSNAPIPSLVETEKSALIISSFGYVEST
jgi:hypothetical protein